MNGRIRDLHLPVPDASRYLVTPPSNRRYKKISVSIRKKNVLYELLKSRGSLVRTTSNLLCYYKKVALKMKAFKKHFAWEE